MPEAASDPRARRLPRSAGRARPGGRPPAEPRAPSPPSSYGPATPSQNSVALSMRGARRPPSIEPNPGAARARPGPDGGATAWEGAAVDDRRRADARRSSPEDGAGVPADRPRGARSAAELSPREREVLRLLVEGQTDREIAYTLGLSYRTVTTHVARAYAKLGVRSRAAAAAVAVRRGLV